MKLSSLRKSLDRTTRQVQGASKVLLDQLWKPQDGPQTEAFLSPADELLFGGAAGF
ncbi:hypothetical protein [Nostoc linckia]|uniref:hypothetical protein n=1 Tax=Nostoc linckia TaxID=92942 RepID=UPI0015D4C67E|nr:hypothetical protein [Nostoc linckia]